MRVPADMTTLVFYICLRLPDGRYWAGGTGVFVDVRSETDGNLRHIYLVTAKHVVERARTAGPIFARFNEIDGGYHYVELPDDWIFGRPADDVAVIPAPSLEGIEWNAISLSSFIEQAATENGYPLEIGIGQDVVMVGLFTEREGTHRNVPIVRTGIIASMPDEPLLDEATGESYDAYLVEMRSIGGHSGSPVFAITGGDYVGQRGGWSIASPVEPWFIGIVRGHWDAPVAQRSAPDLVDDWLDAPSVQVNMGIARVTTSGDIRSVLLSPEEVHARRVRERRSALNP